jgi:hypothetical protein
MWRERQPGRPPPPQAVRGWAADRAGPAVAALRPGSSPSRANPGWPAPAPPRPGSGRSARRGSRPITLPCDGSPRRSARSGWCGRSWSMLAREAQKAGQLGQRLSHAAHRGRWSPPDRGNSRSARFGWAAGHCSGSSGGVRSFQERASWYALQTRSTSASVWRPPTTWSPTGSPSSVRPHGTLAAGCWVRLNG